MKIIRKRGDHTALPLKEPRKGDAGIDVALIQDIIIPPAQTMKVSTGWMFQMPQGWHLWAAAKSRASGIYAIEAPIIDNSYRGIVHAVIRNLDNEGELFLGKGTYVMQLIPFLSPKMHLVDGDLDETERGGGGFGSTG